MSEANGHPRREPTPFERVLAELPRLSDAERGRLRAILCRPQLVSRDREPQGPVGSKIVQSEPYVTEV